MTASLAGSALGAAVAGALVQSAGARAAFAFVGAANASISRLVISGDRWIVRGFNDTAHLEGLS